MSGINPPIDWQPMPREAREIVRREGVSVGIGQFTAEYQDAIDAGDIEVEFRVKNSRYPDSGNRFWWRRKQKTLFE